MKEEISRLFREVTDHAPDEISLQQLVELIFFFRGKTPSGEERTSLRENLEIPIPKEFYDSLNKVWMILNGLLSDRPDLRALYPELVQLETFLTYAGCVESLTRRRGRPPKSRTRVKMVAAGVRNALERMGHTRPLSPTNPDSQIPIIAAGILGFIDGKVHSPEGVISALRTRDRSKKV